MLGKTETDRKMWFSMWFLASIVTFGLAFFPMFYYLIDRRNKHFRRQDKLEKRALSLFQDEAVGTRSISRFPPERNAKLWAVSIILIVPAIIVMYFLTKDLVLHEKHQQELLESLFLGGSYVPQNIALRNYVLVTVATLGVGMIYWLYKLLNIYNYHFKEQRKIEDEITRLLDEKSHVKPV